MERKVKYDYAFKLECVSLVINEHYSCGSASHKKGISESNIRKWVSFYKAYGKAGLLARKNRVYSIDFKQEVVRSIAMEPLSLREARLQFNIPTDSTIIRWQRDFATFGVKGLAPKAKGRARSMSNFKSKKPKSNKPLTREEELLLENEALRCEVDLLKKLQALTQARKNSKP